MAYNSEGKRLNFVDRGIRLNLRPDQYQRIMSTSVVQRIALDVPPEAMALRIAILDPAAERVGSLEVPISPLNK